MIKQFTNNIFNKNSTDENTMSNVEQLQQLLEQKNTQVAELESELIELKNQNEAQKRLIDKLKEGSLFLLFFFIIYCYVSCCMGERAPCVCVCV